MFHRTDRKSGFSFINLTASFRTLAAVVSLSLAVSARAKFRKTQRRWPVIRCTRIRNRRRW